MMFPKDGRVRLKGKALSALNTAIHNRDNHKCVVCGVWVDDRCKFHHEPCGANKSDEIEKGVVLCSSCHFGRHNGKDSMAIKRVITDYLQSIYG